jgi:hypothetical protein
VVSWVIAPAAPAVVAAISAGLGPTWQIGSLADLTTVLMTMNDKKGGTLGLKEDVIAHDLIAATLRDHPACVTRAAELCDCLVQVALKQPHRRAIPTGAATVLPALFRFDPT